MTSNSYRPFSIISRYQSFPIFISNNSTHFCPQIFIHGLVVKDPVVGFYFVDHIHRVNLLDDPRSSRLHNQEKDAHREIESTIQMIEKKMSVLEEKKSEAADLTAVIEKLKNANRTAPEISLHSLQLHILNEEIKQLTREIEITKDSIGEMKQLLRDLEDDKIHQLERQQDVQKQINALEAQLVVENRQSQVLVSHLMTMQAPTTATTVVIESEQSDEQKDDNAQSVHLPPTRLERELNLLALKKRLNLQQRENRKLKEIAEVAKQEPPTTEKSIVHVPKWVEMLNDTLEKSKTLRIKAKSKANESTDAGEVMNFKEKLSFFISHAHDADDE